MNELALKEETQDSNSQVLCLCEIDNATSSGLTICPGISRIHYTACMMQYKLTSLECLKVEANRNNIDVRHYSQEKNDPSDKSHVYTTQAVDTRKRLLQSVSGCDSNGWLMHKHKFILQELATRDETATSQLESPYFECVVSSAITQTLNNVRNSFANEVRRHVSCLNGRCLISQ